MENLLLAGSFALGLSVAGGVSFCIFKKKFQQREDELQRSILDIEHRSSEEKRKFLTTAKEKSEDHEFSVSNLQSQLSIREEELELAKAVEANFIDALNSEQLWQACFRIVEARFKQEIALCAAFRFDQEMSIIPANKVGSDNHKVFEAFHAVAKVQDISEGPKVLALDEMNGLRTLREDLKHVALIPVKTRNGITTIFVAGITSDSYQEQMRLLKKMLNRLAHELYRSSMYEMEIQASRVDHLTGLPNRKALAEVLPKLLATSSEERKLSCLVIECDNIKTINDKYGHLVGDQLIKQLVTTILQSHRIEELQSEIQAPDYLIRYGGLQFMLVLEETDTKTALVVAERIRTAVENKTDWVGGVPTWSVSIGTATSPEDGIDGDMLFLKAEVALMYLKEKLGLNHSIAFSQVPRTFRVSKLSAKVDGSLDIFDPATILQSFVHSDRTGILTVNSTDGRKFWAFVDKRRIQKAYLGPYRSDFAITEFLSTFENGQFAFNEYNSLDSEALEELHRMDATFDTAKTLERYLLDGALAQDKLSAAKRMITNARLFVKPLPEARTIIAGLPGMKDPPDSVELSAMEAIVKHVNGRTMLAAIFDRLDNYPTYVRWHAASVLIQHGVIDLTKLAMTFSL